MNKFVEFINSIEEPDDYEIEFHPAYYWLGADGENIPHYIISDEKDLVRPDEDEEEWEGYEDEDDDGSHEIAKLDEDKFNENPWWMGPDSGKKSTEPELQGMVIYDTKKGRVDQRFPTVGQYLNYVYSPVSMSDDSRISHRPHGARCLGLSWDEARKVADLGWPEGVEKVKNLTLKLNKVLAGIVKIPEVVHDVTGQNLDMGRWVNDEPEDFMSMVESEKEVKQPKIIRLVTTVDIASSPEAFITRGAAVIALTQVLERSNFRVQIDCHIGSNNIVDTWVRAKEANRPVNLESLVFLTCHPVMFWRMSYGAWEHLDEKTRKSAGNLGTSSMGWISEPRVEDRGDVYVSAYGSVVQNSDSMVRWVVGELVKFGIEVEKEK